MMLFLLGCTQPGVLGAISDELANELVSAAAPTLHRSGAIGLLIGELAMSDDPRTESCDGTGARMLGVGIPEVLENESGSVVFTYEPVGTDGALGTLILETNPAFTSYTVAFQWPNGLMSGTLTAAVTPDFAAVQGNLEEDLVEGEDTVVLLTGSYPFVGLAFDPWSDEPSGGSQMWTRGADDPKNMETVSLTPAETTDFVSGWPALADGDGWARDVVMDWP